MSAPTHWDAICLEVRCYLTSQILHTYSKKVTLGFQLTDKVVYKTTSLFGNVSAYPTALVGLNLTGTQVVYECIAKMQQEPCLIFL